MRNKATVLIAALVVAAAGCAPSRDAQPSQTSTVPIQSEVPQAEESPAQKQVALDVTYDGESYWGVIIGSFRADSLESPAAVEKAQRRLGAKGFPAYWAVSDWFSSLRPGYLIVFTAPFSDSSEAAKVAKRLRKMGFKGAYPRRFTPDDESFAALNAGDGPGFLFGDDEPLDEYQHMEGLDPYSAAGGFGYGFDGVESASEYGTHDSPYYYYGGHSDGGYSAGLLYGDANGDGDSGLLYPAVPYGANPSDEWTGKHREWHWVEGYYRRDGTYVRGHYRRTE